MANSRLGGGTNYNRMVRHGMTLFCHLGSEAGKNQAPHIGACEPNGYHAA
jgi:hypothetical protein